MTPWRYGHNHDQRKDVEHDDAYGDGVDSAWQYHIRIFGFRRGGADQLYTNKGKDRDLKTGEKATEPFRKKSPVLPQIAHGCDSTRR
ncbi:hypothetical protein DZJ_40220 [Dickeya ananatis]